MDEGAALRKAIVDRDAALPVRLDAARRMAEAWPKDAIEAVLEAVSTSDESPDVYRELGYLLGRLASEHGHLSEWDMRDMGAVAWAAYCETLQ